VSTPPPDPTTPAGADGPPVDPDTVFGLPTPTRRLRVEGLLGQGGTAHVHRAVQTALGRHVAVKSLAPHARTRDHRQRLLREAFVTGALEHPNVVPIYDILIDDGEPQILMKQVDGREWAALIDDPPAPDGLEWNLRVLLAVCDAVRFAHDRGFLHRDLKPENVMIGRFGEVMVLDWGLAVSLRPGETRVPSARDVDRVSGTPGYLAPEMAAARGDRLDERTDVYLLGGLLHRIVAGRPPRTGTDVDALLRSAIDDDVPIDPKWPLADLLRSALDRDPAQRPSSAGEFRAAIEAWLLHRDALRLVEAGRARLLELRQAVAANAPRELIHEAGISARFAFREALERWPEAPAGPGLLEVGLALARYEVDRGDGESARLQLAGLPDVPAELTAAVRSLEDRKTAAAAQLRAFRADSDARTALVPRLVVTGALAGVWIGSPLLSVVVGVPVGYPREFAISAFIAVFSAALMGALWPWFLRSQMNRTLVVLLLATPSFALFFLITCALAGLPAELAAGLEGFTYFTMVSLAAALVDWRLVPSGLAHGVAFVVGATHPEWTLAALGTANVVFGANIALLSVAHLIWRPR
jgi:tRNA A-37 threonylcarbamoyl transferase component Bud32